MRTISAIALIILALVQVNPAFADWYEDFDSYQAGISLHGHGGWEGWGSNPATTAYVSDLYAHSGSNSVEVGQSTDMVHPFSGYESGNWAFSCWVFIPNEFTGESDCILLNTYPADLSIYGHWSSDIVFDGTSNVVYWLYEPSINTPLVRNQWVEIQIIIDLDQDNQRVYYNGDLLVEYPWVRLNGGSTHIEALDLYTYNYGGSPIYFDDFMLVSGSVATEKTTLSSIKCLYR